VAGYSPFAMIGVVFVIMVAASVASGSASLTATACP
jgi:hypothetical protein